MPSITITPHNESILVVGAPGYRYGLDAQSSGRLYGYTLHGPAGRPLLKFILTNTISGSQFAKYFFPLRVNIEFNSNIVLLFLSNKEINPCLLYHHLHK